MRGNKHKLEYALENPDDFYLCVKCENLMEIKNYNCLCCNMSQPLFKNIKKIKEWVEYELISILLEESWNSKR
jgi:hypothetical protein